MPDVAGALLRTLPGRAAHRPVTAADAVSRSAIRTWCDTMGELTTNGLLACAVGEWTGHARLLRLKTRLQVPAYPHNTMTLRGAATLRSDEVTEVTMRALVRGGVHAAAVAEVRTPR